MPPPNLALDEAADGLIKAWELYGSPRFGPYQPYKMFFVSFYAGLPVCLMLCLVFIFLALLSCLLFNPVRLTCMLKGYWSIILERGKHLYCRTMFLLIRKRDICQ